MTDTTDPEYAARKWLSDCGGPDEITDTLSDLLAELARLRRITESARLVSVWWESAPTVLTSPLGVEAGDLLDSLASWFPAATPVAQDAK